MPVNVLFGTHGEVPGARRVNCPSASGDSNESCLVNVGAGVSGQRRPGVCALARPLNASLGRPSSGLEQRPA